VRVLLVNKHAYLLGGVDSHCAWLAEGLRRRGHEVMWMSTQADSTAAEQGAFVPRRKGAARALQALWSRPAAGAMCAAIERFRPDIVHAHMLYPLLSVAPLVVARRHRVPVVHTLHTYELLSAHYASESGGWIDREGGRLADRAVNTATFPIRRLVHPRLVNEYIAVSGFVADAHARRGIQAQVVRNAVPANGAAVRGFDERRGILFVGRLVAEKGVLDMLELARRLPEIPVTLVGGGPLWRTVNREAERLPNLTCTGWLEPPDVETRLRAARVLAMPSRCAETSGLAALEALACGTPVVALPSGGLAELVRESGGGRLVDDAGDGLASACRELHGDRATWEDLSGRGLEAVAGPFSIATWLDRVEAVYARALNGGAGHGAKTARNGGGR
jgi:glycosyltransferase involved in cell wall biosynthesis